MAYELQPGTIPHAIVEHLRGLGPGVEISCKQAAVVAGRDDASGLRSVLKQAITAGLIAVRVVSPRYSWYRLGDGIEIVDETDDTDIRRVSAMAAPSIFAFAEQRGAADFSTALSSDGRLILQRKGRVIAELTPEEARVHRDFMAKRQMWETAE